jgi:hypothetical protein
VVDAAVQADQLHPPARQLFEGLDLGRVDNVLHDAGDHSSA